MDALLLSLILCTLVETDGTMAHLYARASGAHSGAMFTLFSGVAAIIAALSATGAEWLMPLLTPEARSLFLAVALAMAGGALLYARLMPQARKAESRDAISPARLSLRLFVAGLGGSAPLLIAGVAVRFADPWLAGIGGALGLVAGCVVGRECGVRAHTIMRLGSYGLAVVLLLAAFALAMNALQLI